MSEVWPLQKEKTLVQAGTWKYGPSRRRSERKTSRRFPAFHRPEWVTQVNSQKTSVDGLSPRAPVTHHCLCHQVPPEGYQSCGNSHQVADWSSLQDNDEQQVPPGGGVGGVGVGEVGVTRIWQFLDSKGTCHFAITHSPSLIIWTLPEIIALNNGPSYSAVNWLWIAETKTSADYTPKTCSPETQTELSSPQDLMERITPVHLHHN